MWHWRVIGVELFRKEEEHFGEPKYSVLLSKNTIIRENNITHNPLWKRITFLKKSTLWEICKNYIWSSFPQNKISKPTNLELQGIWSDGISLPCRCCIYWYVMGSFVASGTTATDRWSEVQITNLITCAPSPPQRPPSREGVKCMHVTLAALIPVWYNFPVSWGWRSSA